MLFEEDDDNESENYMKERNKRIKLREKRLEAETEINEEKKEIPVKKELDLNWLWDDSEENSKDNDFLDEFGIKELKEDEETSNNFTPVEDDIKEFKPEVKEENEKMIIDLEPSNSDFPDFEIKMDKKDN